MFETVRRDISVSLRGLRAAPLVTAVAVLSLGLGIAANTTVFTLVHALEFPHLIYPAASRIVFLESKNTTRGPVGLPVSAPDADDIIRASQTLSPIGIAGDQQSILRFGDVARRVSGRRVTPAFFDTLGVQATLGRVLTAADPPGTIVLSDALWRSAFAADQSIVGRAVRLDGGTVEVAGVMPPYFDADAEFWTRLRSAESGARDDRQWSVFARLRDGVSVEAAQRDLEAISNRLALEHPATNRDWVVYPIPIAQLHGRDSRQSFLLLQAAVACLLLIACANIANLLLARGTERRYDVALRISLGATRRQIARSVLVESLLVSAAGGLAGAMLSIWGVRIARRMGGFPDVLDPQLNLPVLLFCAAITTITGVLCGLVPAWRTASVSADAILRGSAGGSTSARSRVRSALVVAQIAAALVLATSAALMAQTMINRQRVDLGFDPSLAVRADLALPWDQYPDLDKARNTVEQAIAFIASQPDVTAAGAVTWALPAGAGGQRALTLPAAQDAPLPSSVRRTIEAVTPGYFAAMSIPLRAGRGFRTSDQAGTTPVGIVNEELARHLWPGRHPVGERLRLGSPGDQSPVVTIVGVVATVRRSVMHDVPLARVYVPYPQHPNRTVTLVVRTHADTGQASRAIAAGIRHGDPMAFAEGVRTVAADIAQYVAPIRLMTMLLAGFAVAAVLLAGLGVFGTMSYTVMQQRRDLAVRSALGASRSDLLRMVFTRALLVTAAGIAIGAGAATLATRGLRAYLFGVDGTDPFTYTATAVFLGLVSLAACYLPARRAATIDPLDALRGQ